MPGAGRFDRLLPQIADFFEKTSRQHFLACAFLLFALAVEVNGVGLIPYEHYQKYAQHPFVTRSDISPRHEWQDSILLPLIAFWTGATERLTFNLLCGAILLAGYGIVLSGMRRRHGEATALLLFVLLLGHPVSAVLWSWIGMPDCITFLCAALAFFVRSRSGLFVLASLSMVNHPAGPIALAMILLLRYLAREEGITPLHFGFVLAGTLLGGALERAFIEYHEIHVFSRLQYVMAFTFDDWAQNHLSSLPAVIYSFHQTLWPVIIYLLIRYARRDPRYFLTLAAMLLGAYAVTSFTVDSTRVFTLLTWGATIHAIGHALALNAREKRAQAATPLAGLVILFALAALIIPRFFVWGGTVIRTPGGPLTH